MKKIVAALLLLLTPGCETFRQNLNAAREKCENAGGSYNLFDGGCVYNVRIR